jgi:5-methylcytosine-specific restriction endonuclease McrA
VKRIKRCNRCGEEKPVDEFQAIVRKSGPQAGYSFTAAYCKPCDNERVREYLKADRSINNRAVAKHYAKRLAEDPEGWRRFQADRQKRWRDANKDKASANQKRWNDANPGRSNDHNHRARAQKVGKVNYREIIERDKGACYLCGLPVDVSLPKGDPLSKHFDHVIPLSKGGPHSMENIRLTHARCNYRKAARLHEAGQDGA